MAAQYACARGLWIGAVRTLRERLSALRGHQYSRAMVTDALARLCPVLLAVAMAGLLLAWVGD
jgi:hypothetical protein